MNLPICLANDFVPTFTRKNVHSFELLCEVTKCHFTRGQKHFDFVHVISSSIWICLIVDLNGSV